MEGRRLRLLYLGNQCPPGWGGRLRSLHLYAGDAFLWHKLSGMADVSAVSLMHWKFWEKRFEPKDETPGLNPELFLWDRNPALWHRWISWRQLRAYYLRKVEQGQMPDAIVVYNLQHVFNHFVKWLRRQPKRPLIILRIGDSGGLGEKIPLSRRLRYLFKPMQMLEAQAVRLYEDGCLLSSVTSKKYFEPRGIPWHWHPTNYKFEYTPPPQSNSAAPINFGYFGTISKVYAITSVARAFLKANVPGTLYMCGRGEPDQEEELKKLSQLHPNFRFDGFLPKESDCLDWAQKVDVLINSRFPVRGQENSFPSKVLEYGVAGKAILTTRVGGTDAALGDEGIYFETHNFEESLAKKFQEVSAMDRAELQRRGGVIRERVLKEFSAEEQARRVVEFLSGLVKSRGSSQPATKIQLEPSNASQR
jgi:glycosyltransferase involved in cell wall biosynthesis